MVLVVLICRREGRRIPLQKEGLLSMPETPPGFEKNMIREFSGYAVGPDKSLKVNI